MDKISSKTYDDGAINGIKFKLYVVMYELIAIM